MDNKNIKPAKKCIFRPRLTMTLCCVVMFAIIEFILTPLYIYTYSDVTVNVTVLPNAIELILELFEIFTFAAVYSLIIYCAVTKAKKTVYSLCGIYLIATLLRRLASLLISYISYGYVDRYDIFNVTVYVVFEVLQLIFVAITALLISKKYYEDRKKKEKAARTVGDFSSIKSIDFSKAYSSTNPFTKSALICGIMLAAVNVAMRVFYDLSYGAPEGLSEILIMIAYYLSDILSGVILYTVAWIIMSKLFKKENSTNIA